MFVNALRIYSIGTFCKFADVLIKKLFLIMLIKVLICLTHLLFQININIMQLCKHNLKVKQKQAIYKLQKHPHLQTDFLVHL